MYISHIDIPQAGSTAIRVLQCSPVSEQSMNGMKGRNIRLYPIGRSQGRSLMQDILLALNMTLSEEFLLLLCTYSCSETNISHL